MLSLNTLRKIDPEIAHLTDEELEEVRKTFYAFGQLMFEDWCEKKFGSKNPIGSLHKDGEEVSIK